MWSVKSFLRWKPLSHPDIVQLYKNIPVCTTSCLFQSDRSEKVLPQTSHANFLIPACRSMCFLKSNLFRYIFLQILHCAVLKSRCMRLMCSCSRPLNANDNPHSSQMQFLVLCTRRKCCFNFNLLGHCLPQCSQLTGSLSSTDG